MKLNGMRVNSGYSVGFKCAYKELLCNCGSSQAPTTLPVLMTSYTLVLVIKSKLNRKLCIFF